MLIANEIKTLTTVPNNSRNHRVDRVLSYFLQSAELGPPSHAGECVPNGRQLITRSPILTILVTSLDNWQSHWPL